MGKQPELRQMRWTRVCELGRDCATHSVPVQTDSLLVMAVAQCILLESLSWALFRHQVLSCHSRTVQLGQLA